MDSPYGSCGSEFNQECLLGFRNSDGFRCSKINYKLASTDCIVCGYGTSCMRIVICQSCFLWNKLDCPLFWQRLDVITEIQTISSSGSNSLFCLSVAYLDKMIPYRLFAKVAIQFQESEEPLTFYLFDQRLFPVIRSHDLCYRRFHSTYHRPYKRMTGFLSFAQMSRIYCLQIEYARQKLSDSKQNKTTVSLISAPGPLDVRYNRADRYNLRYFGTLLERLEMDELLIVRHLSLHLSCISNSVKLEIDNDRVRGTAAFSRRIRRRSQITIDKSQHQRKRSAPFASVLYHVTGSFFCLVDSNTPQIFGTPR